MEPSLSSRFVSVFEGRPSEVYVVQATLEAQGFHTFAADETIKTIDPFITGVGMLRRTLQVPSQQVEAARSYLAKLEASRKEAPGARVAQNHEPTLERLGRRLRWGALASLFAPIVPRLEWLAIALFGVFYLRYFLSTVTVQPKPRAHRATLVSGVVMIALLAAR